MQGVEAAGRPIGLIAYLIMGYAATFLAYTWAESMRLGFAIYGIFDFTSTYMYNGWTIKVTTTFYWCLLLVFFRVSLPLVCPGHNKFALLIGRVNTWVAGAVREAYAKRACGFQACFILRDQKDAVVVEGE